MSLPVTHALFFLGLKEDPNVPNGGDPARLFNAGEAKPWCASFVAEAFRRAGNPLPGKPWLLPSVEYLETQLKANGVWWPVADLDLGGERVPREGDLVFFNWRLNSDPSRPGAAGRHVELTLSYDGRKRRLETIGGNVGNAVRRQHRSLVGVTGFARWEKKDHV